MKQELWTFQQGQFVLDGIKRILTNDWSNSVKDFQVKFWLQKYVFSIFCQVWKTHRAISLQQGLQFYW